MMNVEESVIPDFLLHDSDFPDNFVNMAHPDDYEYTDVPIKDYICHMNGRHNRLILRISWKVKHSSGKDKYIPMSFVCDTGATMFFYLSTNAINALKAERRLSEDETGTLYVIIDTPSGSFKALIEETPNIHAPANIIGLRMLLKLGIQMREREFSLLTELEYF